jgi:hypothetical protein
MSTPNGTGSSRPANADNGNPTDAIEPHILAKLDPDFVKYYVEVLSKNPPAQAMSIEQVRAHPDKFRNSINLDTTGWELVVDRTVTSEDGAEIPVRVYYPDPAVHGEGPYPVHLNFHGKFAPRPDIFAGALLTVVCRRWVCAWGPAGGGSAVSQHAGRRRCGGDRRQLPPLPGYGSQLVQAPSQLACSAADS